MKVAPCLQVLTKQGKIVVEGVNVKVWYLPEFLSKRQVTAFCSLVSAMHDLHGVSEKMITAEPQASRGSSVGTCCAWLIVTL